MWQPQPDYLLLWMGQSTGPIFTVIQSRQLDFWVACNWKSKLRNKSRINPAAR